MIERYKLMIKASHTRRFHTGNVIKQQTVGEHTFNMMIIADTLYDGNPPPGLMQAILYHDMHEGITGDIPWPMKRSSPELYEEIRKVEQGINKNYQWEHEQSKLLEAIDMLEFLCYMVAERNLGNANNLGEYNAALGAINELIKHLDKEMEHKFVELYSYILENQDEV
jgi:5'-deoxynucleotidase YfbR-like HD superfamily hydrolase